MSSDLPCTSNYPIRPRQHIGRNREANLLGGFEIDDKLGRQGKVKTYDFKTNRLGKYYEHKRVEVFFVVEGDVIVTVTVYVFYGKWEIDDGNSV